MHSGSRLSSFGRGSFGRGSFNRPLSTRAFRNSGVGLRIRTRGFRNNCFGYGCAWGYGYPWYGIDPYWWWDSDSSDPSPDYGPQYDNGLANQMNQQGLYPRRMPEPGDQDAYSQPSPLPQHQEQASEVVPRTVLIFNDQHRQEVQNYAIVGQTLWAFAPQRTQKIPLSDLDLPATIKANDDRGVDFKVPTMQGKLTLEYQSVDN